MKVVGLLSGGKDSCYNLLQCVAAGHEVTCLANLAPRDPACLEADSHMYQTIGWSCVAAIAEAMELPLYVETVAGTSVSVGRDYERCEEDEVEDLARLLARVQAATGVTGVAVGAILSDYQRVRVEAVCLRLGLTPLAYLWQRDQAELLREMIAAGMESVLVKVACLGLDRRHLGRSLAEMRPELDTLAAKFGVNVCGEGGEYETLTLDCPLFRHRLQPAASEVVTHSEDAFAPVHLLNLQCELKKKNEMEHLSHEELVRSVEIDGQSLIEVISPRKYCDHFYDMENVVIDKQVKVEELDLRCEEESLTIGESSWFETCTLGRSSNDAECVEEAFTSLKRLLSDHNSELKDVVKVVMCVDQMGSYAAMNTQYATHFGTNPPVRVCVAARRDLMPPGARLVLRCLGQVAAGGAASRRVLHVQGVSHWAPANIGPYSQGLLQDSRLLLSGSIGLVPGTMALVSESEAAQAGLALRHVARVAEVVAGASLGRATRVSCYVTSVEAARQAEHVWAEHEDTDSGVEVRFLLVSELPRSAKVEWEVEMQTVIDNTDD